MISPLVHYHCYDLFTNILNTIGMGLLPVAYFPLFGCSLISIVPVYISSPLQIASVTHMWHRRFKHKTECFLQTFASAHPGGRLDAPLVKSVGPSRRFTAVLSRNAQHVWVPILTMRDPNTSSLHDAWSQMTCITGAEIINSSSLWYLSTLSSYIV